MRQISHQIRIQVAWTILISSLLVISLFSVFYYYSLYSKQSESAKKSIEQLMIIVQQTAATAAYLDQQDLAKEVVYGLAKNDLVLGAKITSQSGLIQQSDKFSIEQNKTNNGLIMVAIKSPFDGRHIGQLMILPDEKFIQQQTFEQALNRAQAMIVVTLLVALLIFMLISSVLTEPLKKIAVHLHQIIPGSDDRVKCPSGHEKNEIGGLTVDVNCLLDSMQNIMVSERELHLKTKKLEKQFRLLVEEASAGVILLNENNDIIICNRAFKKMLSINPGKDNKDELLNITQYCSPAEELSSMLSELRNSDDYNTIAYDFQLQANKSAEGKLVHGLFSKVNTTKDELQPLAEADELFIEGIIYDVTERVQRENLTRFEADHDVLTGLYNRRAGRKLLEKQLLQTIQKNSIYAIFMIDLDKFKPINDLYGHETGDVVLGITAERLRSLFREKDIIIRWGGDEFIIGLSLKEDIERLSSIAEKIIQQVCGPISISQQRQCSVDASIGIAYSPLNGSDLDQLIRAADSAMYTVKHQGRNGYKFYSESDMV